PAQWAAAFLEVVQDAIKIIAHSLHPTIGPSGELDEPRILSTAEGIALNGWEDSHEPSELNPTLGDFTFCKTARKPYDETVTAILIRAKFRAGSGIMISSDGDWEEWGAGRELVERI
ncbi:hypothetical protein MMC28_011764, partial [Mycoblastus sanguinarius]|nr:hypothetical protein [Mycoblastus sanguinarius]